MNKILRRCNTCGNLKQLDKFVKDIRITTGYKGICKRCFTKYQCHYKRKRRNSKLYKRKCTICKREFETWWKHRVTCSPHCSKLRGRERMRKRAEERHPKFEVECCECGKLFKQKIQTQKYCSKKCRKKAGRRSLKRNGRIYFPIIKIDNVCDRKIRYGMVDHHFNNFCTVPVPLIPHTKCGGPMHRKQLKKWVEKLYVSAMVIECNVREPTSEDYIRMGWVAFLEYDGFAKFSTEIGGHPKYNKK